MVNSRRKGARGELEARDAVRKFWFAPHCIRSAQANGAYSADLLSALPGGHVEVKLIQRIAALRYLDQAARDRKEGEFPVVLMRENAAPQWVVMFPIDCTDAFVDAYLQNRLNNDPSENIST